MGYERMFYTIEKRNGQKVVHYVFCTTRNGEVPDGWDEDEYMEQDETSIDVIDFTGIYLPIADVVGLGKEALGELLRKVEERAGQYVDRIIEHLWDERTLPWTFEHLDLWDVADDTEAGLYWSVGYWA